MGIATSSTLQAQRTTLLRPTALQCNSLTTPLGIDEKQPQLSWKLQDGRMGARQTAYQILVASKPSLLKPGSADIWDSGRMESDRSVSVPYGGPVLAPTTRYFWNVQVWDKDGQPYPPSEASWWETGLLDSKNWLGHWIGYEDLEHSSIREAEAQWISNPAIADYRGEADTHHDFRISFDLPRKVRRVVLYVTAEDTVAAWINGKQVLEAIPLPPWGRNPWKTYRKRDVTSELHKGQNLLAIEAILYHKKDRSQAPMSSMLYIEMKNGSTRVLKTGDPDWKAAFNAPESWYARQYDDTNWSQAVPYTSAKDAFGGQDPLGSPLPTAPVAALRRGFQISKPVLSARLYATALGVYKFSLNGKPVTNQELAPGWTDYRQRVTYQAYDVTSSLKAGANAIGAYLGPGWYSTPLEWIGQGNNYGTTPNALKAQLRIEYEDGSVEWVQTDESWKANLSPISFAEIYDGETYDARKAEAGWDTASFSDKKWHPVSLIQPKEPDIVWQSFQPIHQTEILTAKAMSTPKPRVFIYDFGQELAGVVGIHVKGKGGTDIQLRFAEVLNLDGTLYIENLRNAKATDHYILSGKGEEEYQPSFTFHGFRYLEITGLKNPPALSAIKAIALHTDAPVTADLQTGSSLINQLWSNILWGQRSNFLSVPTDCPQRDERLGWSADAQVFWRAASFNMNLTAFSRKYAADLHGTQVDTPMYGIYAPGTLKPNPGYGTGWSDAGIIIPWTSWIQSGDTSILDQNWSGMEEYLKAIQAANPDYLWKNNYGIPFGDWLSPEGSTPQELIATAYWAYDVTLMKQMAHALGKAEEEQKYADLFEKIKAAFMSAYVHPDGLVNATPSSAVLPSGVNGNRTSEPVETQTGYVLALHMNLLPDSMRPLAAIRLVDRIAANGWKLGTGFLGTPYLLEVLTDTGHADVAYRLLLNTEYPSWGYMVDHGATTMWERWNGDQMRGDPSMNSYNHYAYGAVAEWIYRYAAGIDTVAEDPGFHTILLHPNFDKRLGKLDFSYESLYGMVKSAWTLTESDTTWNVTIPPNTKARLPLSSSQAQGVTVNGESLQNSSIAKAISKQDNEETYELQAGTYSFKMKLLNP